ncbi:MAG: hypothetical protein ABSC19_08640 [Syntrophorhabdales bacterium]|jgi:hypothetical protein
MWIETDHHGIVNLDYVRRIDLGGEIEKETFGIYLFDVDGNTYPIVDISRFRNIGVFQGKETDQDVHTAVYTFYTITKRLIAARKDRDVLTIEAIYKEFASEWYAQQKNEMAGVEETGARQDGAQAGEVKDSGEERIAGEDSGKIQDFSDMKLLLDAYAEGYRVKFQKKPLLRYENEGKIARDLVKLYPLEKLKTMLVWYFESNEDFITKANYDMKTFKAILERTRKVGSSEE